MINNYNFGERLSFHNSWIKVIAEKIPKVLPKLTELKYVQTQEIGISFTCVYKTGKVDVKIRNDNGKKDFYPKTIVLETYSDVDRRVRGWTYTTGSDYVVQCWEFNNQLMPIAFIIDMKRLRESDFFKSIEVVYPTRWAQSNGGRWFTQFRAPNYEDFPPNIVTKFSFEKEKKTRIGDVRDL